MRWILVTCLGLLLAACGDDEAPRITAVDFPADTTDAAGPFVVSAVVTDNRGVHEVNLLLSADLAGAYARERMHEVSAGHFEHALGPLSAGLTLYLIVEAVDTDGNRSQFPDPALVSASPCVQDGSLCWHEFRVLETE